MANEDLSFSMGIDTSGFQRSLRSAKEMASEASEKITDFFKEAAKSLAAPLIGLAAVEGVKKVLEFGESIKRGAEIAGVSTDFFQTLGNAMVITGGDAEKGAKALEKLAGMIGEANAGSEEAAKKFEQIGISLETTDGRAKGAEEVLRDIADKMRAAGSASDAAGIAVAVFGSKLGLELVPALREGSEGLDALGGKMEKLSESEIKALSAMKSHWAEFSTDVEVVAGKMLAFVDSIIYKFDKFQLRHPAFFTQTANRGAAEFVERNERRDAGFEAAKESPQIEANRAKVERAVKDAKILAEIEAKMRTAVENDPSLTNEARLNLLREDGQRIEKAMADQKLSEVEYAQLAYQLLLNHNAQATEGLKIAHERERAEAEAARQATQAAEQRQRMEDELYRADRQSGRAGESLTAAKDKAVLLTLDELASSNLRFTGTLGEDQQKARQIKELERQQEWNRVHGFTDDARERQNAALALRNQLSTANTLESDRHPLKSLEESSADAARTLDNLLKKASNEGFNVNPANGQ